MNLFRIKDEYIKYLKQIDSTVPDNYNETRPYIGVVVECDGIKYYAPLTSPKLKHQTMKNDKDFRRINGGKLGAINFNNMIPVPDSEIIAVIINDEKDAQYKRLLQNQYVCIQKDQDAIENTAKRLRTLVFKPSDQLNQHDRAVKNRCCNLPILESSMEDYVNKNNQSENIDSE